MQKDFHILKRDQLHLLHQKATLEAALKDLEVSLNVSAADNRVLNDENKRLYGELDARDKMTELMSVDFDDEMKKSRALFCDNDELRKSLDSGAADNRQLQADIKHLQDMNQHLQDDLQAKIKHLQDENKILKDRFKDIVEANIKNMRDENKQLKDNIEVWFLQKQRKNVLQTRFSFVPDGLLLES